MTAIHLTLKQVKEAGRAAYLEGRLSAQGPTPSCQYRDAIGRPCIIGAAMSDEDAKECDRRCATGIGSLLRDGIVVSAACAALPALQSAHDSWAGARKSGDEAGAARAERKLRRLLGVADSVPA